MTPSEKRALTKEIKVAKEYLGDLLDQVNKQGDKFFFEFESRKCERYMLHGEYFFPSTIKRVKKEIAELISKRYPDTTMLTKSINSKWVITKDCDVCNDCKNATPEQKEKLAVLGYTEKFKMFDDDGVLYYEGLAKKDVDFEPLDDFGMPNAGCTEIKYLNKKSKKYETI